MREPGRKVVDVIPAVGLNESDDTLAWLAELLVKEGTDLMQATFVELGRGTPVYVNGDAEVIEIRRLMAKRHIRSIPVLSEGRVVGIVDHIHLARFLEDGLSEARMEDPRFEARMEDPRFEARMEDPRFEARMEDPRSDARVEDAR